MGAAFQADPLLSRAAPRGDSGFAAQAMLRPVVPTFREHEIRALPAVAGAVGAVLKGEPPRLGADLPADLAAFDEDARGLAGSGRDSDTSATGASEAAADPVAAAAEAATAATATAAAPARPDAAPAVSEPRLEALLSERYREGFEEGLAQGAQLALAQLESQQEAAGGAAMAGAAADAQHLGAAADAADAGDAGERHMAMLLQDLGRALLDLRGPQAAQARFEPLKRLALHLAVELVRTELSLSPQIIDRLVRRCVEALDAQDDVVSVELNPQDLALMQPLIQRAAQAQATAGTLEAALGAVQWRADVDLARGSVRARSGESTVEDLIEHRLAGLVRDLRVDAQRWWAGQAAVDAAPMPPAPDAERGEDA